MRTSPRRRRSIPARLFGWLWRGVLAFVAVSLVLVLLFKWVPPPVTLTMLFDPKGATRDWTPLSRMSSNLPRAVIAAEDAKFCSHDGFDRDAIEKAIAYNKRGKRIRGGSTISQQTAKNVFLIQGGGFVRKGFEAWFTFLIETIWGKRRIMEVYLNVAETGIGTYGMEAGARRYFHKGAGSLTPAQAARLAAALPSPKKRAVVSPRGFTRRYGNAITRRIGIVRRDALDSCIRD